MSAITSTTSPTTTGILKESPIKSLIKQLSVLLTHEKHHETAFRINNKRLQSLGDLSFQINLAFVAWNSLKYFKHPDFASSKFVKQKLETIFDYASYIHNKAINEHTLPSISKEDETWEIKIVKCVVMKGNCHLFIKRDNFIEKTIKEICNNQFYGHCRFLDHITVKTLCTDREKNDTEKGNMNLSDLRVTILKKIIVNFSSPANAKQSEGVTIFLTTKSSDKAENNILCGCVLNDKGQKEETVTTNDIYNEYESNMRMMFEHKYGVRNITANVNWRDNIAKLGHAAVTFQMIQNAPQKNISLASKHHVIKDAAFVIYNGARISSILRRFDAEVEQKLYPILPHIDDIDFSTLKHNEEWELIYAFLAQYPKLIESSIIGICDGKLNLHTLYEYLIKFSAAFSTYYSRIKIITPPKDHLFATLHARIYLLKAVKVVFSNALRLLNIEPVNQM